MAARMVVRIQSAPFDTDAEIRAISAGRKDIGAVVTFSGLCRDEGGSLAALELEHYPGMAESAITRIVEQAAERWDLDAATAIHRHGRIGAGEPIVLVVTASRHRQAAFAAAEFIMDFMKSRAPFWKKPVPNNGEPGEWIDARDSDEDALRRWDEIGSAG